MRNRDDGSLWHKADVREPPINVRFWGHSGRRNLKASGLLVTQNGHSPAAEFAVPRLPMPSTPRIEGHAIVSEDGMLANAAGIMPDSLKFGADQTFLEKVLIVST